MELPGALLSPSSKKTRRPALKTFLIFSQKKRFSYTLENRTFLYFLKKIFLIFPEMELSSLKNKKFQEVTFRIQKVKRTHS